MSEDVPQAPSLLISTMPQDPLGDVDVADLVTNE